MWTRIQRRLYCAAAVAQLDRLEQWLGGDDLVGHLDLPPERGQRLGDRRVRWRMEVAVLVALMVAGAEVDGRRVVVAHAALEPRSLDVGHVPDQPEQRHVARRARGDAYLLVGQTFGLAGQDPSLVVEEREQGRAFVLGGEFVGWELRHRCVVLGHALKLGARSGPARRWFRAQPVRSQDFHRPDCPENSESGLWKSLSAGDFRPRSRRWPRGRRRPVRTWGTTAGSPAACRTSRARCRDRVPRGEPPIRRARRSPSRAVGPVR